MSHPGTLIHHRVPRTRGPWLERIVMIAVGLALGAAAVVAVDAVRTDTGSSGAATAADVPAVATAAGMNYEDFVRLNTTELGWGLAPTQEYVVESSVQVAGSAERALPAPGVPTRTPAAQLAVGSSLPARFGGWAVHVHSSGCRRDARSPPRRRLHVLD